MPKTTLEKIQENTGREVSFCSCEKCQSQCHTPCLGTPEDIEKLIDAGHKDKIALTEWHAGRMMGLCTFPVLMLQAKHDKETGYCTFFKDGLCSLHDAGLKPTEGKLSHHSISADNFVPQKSVSWAVAKEWLYDENTEVIERLIDKFKQ